MQDISDLSLNLGLAQHYADLTMRRRAIEEELKRVQEEVALVEQELLDEMARAGVSRINLPENLIHLQRQLWAYPANGDAERTADALKRAGVGELVSETVNVHKLSSYVRELERDGREMPGELVDFIDVKDRYRAIVRKAPSA